MRAALANMAPVAAAAAAQAVVTRGSIRMALAAVAGGPVVVGPWQAVAEGWRVAEVSAYLRWVRSWKSSTRKSTADRAAMVVKVAPGGSVRPAEMVDRVGPHLMAEMAEMAAQAARVDRAAGAGAARVDRRSASCAPIRKSIHPTCSYPVADQGREDRVVHLLVSVEIPGCRELAGKLLP